MELGSIFCVPRERHELLLSDDVIAIREGEPSRWLPKKLLEEALAYRETRALEAQSMAIKTIVQL